MSECLHRMATASGKVPRPLGETLRAAKQNKLLHFDFLTMAEGEGGVKYVLVLKDNMSGFVELVSCVQATSDEKLPEPVGLVQEVRRRAAVGLRPGGPV